MCAFINQRVTGGQLLHGRSAGADTVFNWYITGQCRAGYFQLWLEPYFSQSVHYMYVYSDNTSKFSHIHKVVVTFYQGFKVSAHSFSARNIETLIKPCSRIPAQSIYFIKLHTIKLSQHCCNFYALFHLRNKIIRQTLTVV